MKKTIIGVMGAGEQASKADVETAFALGKCIAEQGWVLLSGGRNAGVMDAMNKGAKSAGGLTVGILPTRDAKAISEAVDIPIITDMGSARNNINVLTSHVVIACGTGGAGTASEIALAIKAEKSVILLNAAEADKAFFVKLGGRLVHVAASIDDVIRIAKTILGIA